MIGSTFYVIGGLLTIKISNKKNENVTASILIWATIFLVPITAYVEQPWNLNPRIDSIISGQIKVSNTVALKEFPPVLDLIAPIIGTFGLVAGAVDAAGSIWLSVARTLVGAAFLGAVSNSMLLGHWYLVQPGLSRDPVFTLVNWTGLLWLPELVLLCIPTGMFSVLNGTIDDNYNGLLGWFWVACVVAAICLVIVTRMALKEKEYSAVMAATGLMYLAILTAFGMDLVARILLDA